MAFERHCAAASFRIAIVALSAVCLVQCKMSNQPDAAASPIVTAHVTQPSVSPSTFSAGPPFDWQDPAGKLPRQWGRVTTAFANTRSFDETTKWIVETVKNYRLPADRGMTLSDIRFRGCLMEWDQQWLVTDTHRNDYFFSVNLGDLDVSRSGFSRDSVDLRWDMEKNRTGTRNWEKENGAWQKLAEGTDKMESFPFRFADRENITARLAYAVVHAARLCGVNTTE